MPTSKNKIQITSVEQAFTQGQSVVKKVAVAFFKDRDIADDIVQEVFLKIDRYLPKEFNTQESMLGWLGLVAKNYCKDVYRSQESYVKLKYRVKQQQLSNKKNYEPAQIYQNNLVVTLIENVLKDYSLDQKEIYEYYAFSKLSLKEIQKKVNKKTSYIRYTIEKINKKIYTKAKNSNLL